LPLPLIVRVSGVTVIVLDVEAAVTVLVPIALLCEILTFPFLFFLSVSELVLALMVHPLEEALSTVSELMPAVEFTVVTVGAGIDMLLLRVTSPESVTLTVVCDVPFDKTKLSPPGLLPRQSNAALGGRGTGGFGKTMSGSFGIIIETPFSTGKVRDVIFPLPSKSIVTL
jgi:hypothetical protein